MMMLLYPSTDIENLSKVDRVRIKRAHLLRLSTRIAYTFGLQVLDDIDGGISLSTGEDSPNIIVPIDASPDQLTTLVVHQPARIQGILRNEELACCKEIFEQYDRLLGVAYLTVDFARPPANLLVS
jgi:hypothetical protein